MAHSRSGMEGNKSYIATLLLALLLGGFGADRFYLGKVGTAVLKLVTFGGLGMWWLADVLVTLCGGQRDRRGLRLAGYDKHKRVVWAVIGTYGVFSIVLTLFATMLMSGFGLDGLAAAAWALAATLGVMLITGAGIMLLRKRR